MAQLAPSKPPPSRKTPPRNFCPQATLVTLAADKATAQSRAAELAAKLAQATSENRTRAHASHKAVAAANDCLSSAETRASAAEARVEAVVRHLTVSERRRREAERRAGAAPAAGAETEVGRTCAIEAGARCGERTNAGGQQARVDGALGAGFFGSGRAAANAPVGVPSRNDVWPRARKVEGERLGYRSRPSDPLEKNALDESRSTRGGASCVGDRTLSRRNEARERSRRAPFVDASRERHQQRSGTAATQEEENAGQGPTDVIEAHMSEGKGTRGSHSEVRAGWRRVVNAEQEAAVLRTEADRAKEEAANTAAEAEMEKERAVRESERMGRELRDTQGEMCALRRALRGIGGTVQEEKSSAGAILGKAPAPSPNDENDDVESAGPEKESSKEAPGNGIISATETDRQDTMHKICGEPQEIPGRLISTVEERACTNVSCLAARGPNTSAWAPDPEPVDGNQTVVADAAPCCRTNDAAPGQPAKASGVRDAKGDGDGDGERPLQHHDPLRTESPPAETPPGADSMDTGNPNQDLGEARATSPATMLCRRVPERKIGELEEIIWESERQYAMFRERGERRLEALKLAFDQEEEEAGAKVRATATNRR